MNKLYIEPSAIIGKTFTTSADPNTEYECIGYAANETFLVVGKHMDTVNNRFYLKTFKIQDVRFMP